MTLLRPPDWSEAAACLGLATRARDPWTPGEHLSPEERGFELHLARRICSVCPVRIECAIHELGMLSKHTPESMRGGLSPEEIVDLAKTLGLPHRRRAQHGERSRYVAGCRCAACTNSHRVYEHERRLWARSKKRLLTASEVHAWLAMPIGRGRRRAGVGQLLLFTDGLPAKYVHNPLTPNTEAS